MTVFPRYLQFLRPWIVKTANNEGCLYLITRGRFPYNRAIKLIQLNSNKMSIYEHQLYKFRSIDIKNCLIRSLNSRYDFFSEKKHITKNWLNDVWTKLILSISFAVKDYEQFLNQFEIIWNSFAITVCNLKLCICLCFRNFVCEKSMVIIECE